MALSFPTPRHTKGARGPDLFGWGHHHLDARSAVAASAAIVPVAAMPRWRLQEFPALKGLHVVQLQTTCDRTLSSVLLVLARLCSRAETSAPSAATAAGIGQRQRRRATLRTHR